MKNLKKCVTLIVLVALMITMNTVVLAYEEENPEFRNLAKDLDYEWSEQPDSRYPDTGNQLTDGEYGNLDRLDPAWIGHIQGKEREVVFDLGEKKSISSIRAHFLQDYPTNEILVPLRVSMYVSNDKETWGTLAHMPTELLWGGGLPREEFFVWDGSEDGFLNKQSDDTMAYARYVKVAFQMHGTQWSLLDEIEIWGTDGKIEGAVSIPGEEPMYLEPSEDTADIHNLALMYNGHYDNGNGDLTKEGIIPQISYVNQEGEPIDWLYDGALYLGLLTPSGRSFEHGTANFEDWQWYLNKTFAEQGDMKQLDEATKEVGSKLGQSDHKTKVVLMIPNPGGGLSDFPEEGSNGESEIDWWMNEVQQRWNENNYSNLELVGMYWVNEQIQPGNNGEDLPIYASNRVHEEGLKFFWIPHFYAYKSYMWEDVGFDAAAFQPNYFFENLNLNRLEDAANIAKQYGMGVEIEFDWRILTSEEHRQKYIEYLNGGIDYGYMENTFKAYYQDSGSLLKELAASNDPDVRVLYDWLYQFVNNTYKKTATSSTSIMSRVESLEQDGEFDNEDVAHSLLLHMNAVNHFEKEGKIEKMIKHIGGLKNLLEYQRENELISWLAYNTLRADADSLISEWNKSR